MMLTLGEEWHDHGINARTAYAMMTVPQKNLIQLHGEMSHVQVDQMLANICRTTEILKVAAQFMDFALARRIAAGSVAEAGATLRVK